MSLLFYVEIQEEAAVHRKFGGVSPNLSRSISMLIECNPTSPTLRACQRPTQALVTALASWARRQLAPCAGHRLGSCLRQAKKGETAPDGGEENGVVSEETKGDEEQGFETIVTEEETKRTTKTISRRRSS